MSIDDGNDGRPRKGADKEEVARLEALVDSYDRCIESIMKHVRLLEFYREQARDDLVEAEERLSQCLK